jgi:hypothetical protein
MRKALIFLILFLALNSAIVCQIRLDLKTPWAEKHRLGALKGGVAHFLEWLGYRIVETGEDYAVWLRYFSERLAERDVSEICLQVAVTPPCVLAFRPPLAWKNLALPYRHETVFSENDFDLRDFLGRRGRRRSDRDYVRAYYLGERIAREIDIMISELEQYFR